MCMHMLIKGGEAVFKKEHIVFLKVVPLSRSFFKVWKRALGCCQNNSAGRRKIEFQALTVLIQFYFFIYFGALYKIQFKNGFC